MKDKVRKARKATLSVAGLTAFIEVIFHLYMGLDMKYFPIFFLSAASFGMVCTAILYCLPEKASKIAGMIVVICLSVIFAAECLCKEILQQYYQIISGMETAAGNHLLDYNAAVRDALIVHIPGLFLMVVVPIGCYTVLHFRLKSQEDKKKPEFLMAGICMAAAIILHLAMLGIIFFYPWKGDFTPEKLYQTDTHTEDQVEQLGMITMLRLDIKHSIWGTSGEDTPDIQKEAQETVKNQETPAEEDYPYNEMDIDFAALQAAAATEDSAWLSEYFGSLTPTRQNEYTGMFEGYNVIFITAEGFSGYMIDPELTPTLYKLSTEGFVFENFYSTLHFTSTSGGEFQNLTGLYPKAAFPVSMSETGEQGTSLPFTLANRLNQKGYTSIGYHFNENMYGRDLSHPNLGYEWRQADACGRPVTKETDESGHEYWPQSDDYMIQQSFADYVDKEPFNIYYLTLSGHLPYGFDSNEMSKRNQEAVANLPYSEKTKAYIAAGLELEKGMTSLIEKLEEAGIADRTLLVMAPDHIPYSDLDILEELAGRSFGTDTLEMLDEQNVDFDVYKNTWILWSASIKEPIKVEKPCSQVDILPTLLNLLGETYDSRMLAGTDVMSENDPVVIFFSNSWLTEKGAYDRYTGTFTPSGSVAMSAEEQKIYVENMKYLVECRLRLGELIIENDYYKTAVH